MEKPSASPAERYNLRWNRFLPNLTEGFCLYQKNESMVDVTLSCEGFFIKAHRLILAASSAYFQKIFEVYKDPQLLVLLNDVSFADLQLVIEFMYTGEVKVNDSQVHSFLALGKTMQVKGLCSIRIGSDKKIQCENVSEEKLTAESTTTSSIPEVINSVGEACKSVPLPTEGKKRKLEANDQEETSKQMKRPEDESFKKNALKKKLETSPKMEKTNSEGRKKPPNAFMIFADEFRKKLVVEYPDNSPKDISLKLSNMWKSMSLDAKDSFYEEANKIAKISKTSDVAKKKSKQDNFEEKSDQTKPFEIINIKTEVISDENSND